MLVRRRQILRSKLLDLPGSGRSVSARRRRQMGFYPPPSGGAPF